MIVKVSPELEAVLTTKPKLTALCQIQLEGFITFPVQVTKNLGVRERMLFEQGADSALLEMRDSLATFASHEIGGKFRLIEQIQKHYRYIVVHASQEDQSI